MAKITIINGEDTGRSSTFEREIILGRSPQVDFTLKDLRASRQHSRIVLKDGVYYLEDLQSHNGTFLNGKRVQERETLKSADNIRIGATWLSFTIEDKELREGGEFCGYKIIEELHEDVTGDFYRAEQIALSREVLLWTFSQSELENKEELVSKNTQEDFFFQIRNIAKLFHRNILMILDFAVTKSHFYCVFEFVPLEYNLKKFLQDNPKPRLEESLDIAQQVAQGMAYAHSQNVLHLHLTDKNILLQQGRRRRVVLTDLGVSRFLSSITQSSHGTSTTGILGISNYIAPEQVLGDHPESAATDVYSFGCFLYHILSGELPFNAKTPYELARYHCQDEPIALRSKRLDVPGELVALVGRCMRKVPQERCSFREITNALEQARASIEMDKVLGSTIGQNIVRKQLGEVTLLRWWLILPILAMVVSVLVFFLLPMIQ